jgi:hypothetical protein
MLSQRLGASRVRGWAVARLYRNAIHRRPPLRGVQMVLTGGRQRRCARTVQPRALLRARYRHEAECARGSRALPQGRGKRQRQSLFPERLEQAACSVARRARCDCATTRNAVGCAIVAERLAASCRGVLCVQRTIEDRSCTINPASVGSPRCTATASACLSTWSRWPDATGKRASR